MQQFWDEGHAVGRWFGAKPSLGECGLGSDIAWDAYYLFPPDARWSDMPAPLVSFGCPIVQERERLEKDIEALATKSRPSGG